MAILPSCSGCATLQQRIQFFFCYCYFLCFCVFPLHLLLSGCTSAVSLSVSLSVGWPDNIHHWGLDRYLSISSSAMAASESSSEDTDYNKNDECAEWRSDGMRNKICYYCIPFNNTDDIVYNTELQFHLPLYYCHYYYHSAQTQQRMATGIYIWTEGNSKCPAVLFSIQQRAVAFFFCWTRVTMLMMVVEE